MTQTDKINNENTFVPFVMTINITDMLLVKHKETRVETLLCVSKL